MEEAVPVPVPFGLPGLHTRLTSLQKSRKSPDVPWHNLKAYLYRSTVFWTPLDLKLCGIGQGPGLLLSHLGRGFVAMPSNEPGLIVLTLKRVQRQAQLFHGIKSCKP